MDFLYKKATIADIDFLTAVRVEVLKAANQLSDEVDMELVKTETYQYYRSHLENGQHCAYLVFSGEVFVGAGGVSFFQVMPTYHNPSGRKAYIMNMYTKPEYRRMGIGLHLLDKLVQEARNQVVDFISLEATSMGKPLYEAYGFVAMEHEMELPVNIVRNL